jgi:cell division protease FtsH
VPDPSPAASKPQRPPQTDERKGWRVEPAPDGRGAPPQPKPPMFPRGRRWIALILGLLVLNFVAAFITGGPAERTQVPYSPFFLKQVQAGNVQEISSQGETIQGNLKNKANFTPPGGDTKSVNLFKTEVPSFVDTTNLTKQLESSASARRSCSSRCSSGSCAARWAAAAEASSAASVARPRGASRPASRTA